MDGEAVKGTALVWQSVDAAGVIAFKGIPAAFGSRAGMVEFFNTCLLTEGEGNLLGCVEAGKDHIAVLEDLIYEVRDRGIFLALYEACALTELDALLGRGLSREEELSGL